MDARGLQRYEQLLLAKRREVLGGRSGGGLLAPRAEDRRGDLVDQASGEAETKVQVRLRQTESHLLRAIEEALGRIAQGSFGVCTACRQPISKARLDAVPWTRLCLECKQREKS